MVVLLSLPQNNLIGDLGELREGGVELGEISVSMPWLGLLLQPLLRVAFRLAVLPVLLLCLAPLLLHHHPLLLQLLLRAEGDRQYRPCFDPVAIPIAGTRIASTPAASAARA